MPRTVVRESPWTLVTSLAALDETMLLKAPVSSRNSLAGASPINVGTNKLCRSEKPGCMTSFPEQYSDPAAQGAPAWRFFLLWFRRSCLQALRLRHQSHLHRFAG